jgi:hypothetical protein
MYRSCSSRSATSKMLRSIIINSSSSSVPVLTSSSLKR